MRIQKILFLFILIIACFLFIDVELIAQCPMCRMSAESNLKNGGTAAKGLNNGILYIFVMPYLLISIVGYIWWKKNKKNKELEATFEEGK